MRYFMVVAALLISSLLVGTMVPTADATHHKKCNEHNECK